MRHTLYFKEDFFKKLKEEASKKGLSVSAYIRSTIMTVWENQ